VELIVVFVEQVDIAPTVAEVLGFHFKCQGKPIARIVEAADGCEHVALLIVDSLGYREYTANVGMLSFTSRLASRGIVFKCLSYSHYTTPSIATILCGLKPEVHGVFRTEQAYTRTFKCMPEAASEAGLRVAVVMEEYGATSFQGLVDCVKPIVDRPDVMEFDLEVCREALEVVERLKPNLLVAHLRTLDKLGFNRISVTHVDDIIKRLAVNCPPNTLVVVCGDHPPHQARDEVYVALIASRASSIM